MILPWDLGTNPITWDFAAALVHGITRGCTSVHFKISHFSKSKFSGGKENAEVMAKRRYDHILKPLCDLAGIPYTESKEGEHSTECWHLGDIERLYKKEGRIFKFLGEDPGKRNYVTVTIRESFRNVHKNSNRETWNKVIAEIGKSKEVVVLEDCEYDPFPVATRMALYQYADMNLGVTGGPMALLHFSEAPYLVFNMIPRHDDSNLWAKHFERGGFPPGSQLSFRTPRQKIVWDHDIYEVIMKAYADLLAVPEGS